MESARKINKKFCFVVPCYNEEKGIPKIVKEFLKIREEYDIDADVVFVDDGSTDKSKEIIKENMEKYDWIKIVSHEHNMGFAQTLKDGSSYALEEGYDYIGQMDCDLTHPPSLILKMIKELSSADMVIASRYVGTGGMKNIPRWRVYLSRVGNKFFRIILGIKTLDATSGYRLSKRQVFENIYLESNSYQIQLELTTKVERRGYKVKEIPYILFNREIGSSKFKIRYLLNYIPSMLKLLWQRK